ncbi:MAG: endonuclease IV [Methanomassiliicoccales archaeon PtaU1.Bin124]|nr:MAG: endonuclease IV [Methanomassiliicoccales archaeon PtaU1.Bin124]
MIGISSASLTITDLEATLKTIEPHFKHWEILTESEPYLLDIAKRFKIITSPYDLTYSIHAPIFDVNIASINEKMRMESVEQISTSLKIAAQIDVDLVTIHPGYYPMGVRGFESRAENKLIESLGELNRISNDLGVNLALENMANQDSIIGRTAGELSRFIDGTDLGICFDVGHANTTGQIASILELRDRIINVHLHDNDGQVDSHSSLGDGKIDFANIFHALKGYKGNYIIEARTISSALKSSNYLKRKFADLS